MQAPPYKKSWCQLIFLYNSTETQWAYLLFGNIQFFPKYLCIVLNIFGIEIEADWDSGPHYTVYHYRFTIDVLSIGHIIIGTLGVVLFIVEVSLSPLHLILHEWPHRSLILEGTVLLNIDIDRIPTNNGISHLVVFLFACEVISS